MRSSLLPQCHCYDERITSTTTTTAEVTTIRSTPRSPSTNHHSITIMNVSSVAVHGNPRTNNRNDTSRTPSTSTTTSTRILPSIRRTTLQTCTTTTRKNTITQPWMHRLVGRRHRGPAMMRMMHLQTRSSWVVLVAVLLLSWWVPCVMTMVPDRHRLIEHRYRSGIISSLHDNGYALDGHLYRKQTRSQLYHDIDEEVQQRIQQEEELRKERAFLQTLKQAKSRNLRRHSPTAPWQGSYDDYDNEQEEEDGGTSDERHLSSQLSGCCYNYKSSSASTLCALYGNDCESGNTKSHDSGDSSCTGDGLSFIGISFSVNTASGNPYSYQLCDQFPMEHIIDRDYEYVMSMDEDGWLVGGGYKTFDYSGKMPYVGWIVVVYSGG